MAACALWSEDTSCVSALLASTARPATRRCRCVAIKMEAACSTVQTCLGALVFSVAALTASNWTQMDAGVLRQQVMLQQSRTLLDLSDQVNVTVGTNVTWDDNYTHSWFNWTRGSEEVAVNSSQLQEVGGASGLAEGLSPRIVGGTLEKPGGSPWQVLIRRVDGYGFCGGTLVSDRWVLSAAHCFQQRAHHVTIGDYDKQRKDPGEQMIKVQQVLIHPYFHSFTLDSDIALLYLARPIVRGPTAIPACLPDPHLSTYLLQGDNRGVVTGWGTTKYLGRSSRFLRKVALPVVSHHSCSLSSEQVITDNMFCAGYLKASSDACSGDSGGPFVVNYRGTWFLTGIISWGEECAASGKYGVYTRLGNFLTWIRTTMARVDLNATQS
ncbi:coagulation factor X isoform X4 [Dunckerocampus dactyliophorus]|uniref:coagulation factor X isoform X4 n=1 Tax=Dunckerocampus dactyliophorus TaxID=161453 RepID=UPI002404E88D|nr:coagulation factor X isoform X4 [Dunckerocampus dactyliophorus]